LTDLRKQIEWAFLDDTRSHVRACHCSPSLQQTGRVCLLLRRTKKGRRTHRSHNRVVKKFDPPTDADYDAEDGDHPIIYMRATLDNYECARAFDIEIKDKKSSCVDDRLYTIYVIGAGAGSSFKLLDIKKVSDDFAALVV
jgi:hypothetical protein